MTVRAKWTINKYIVTLSAGNCISSVKIDSTNSISGTFNDDTQLNISYVASNYCQFSSWSDGGSSNSRKITVNGNINLTAYVRYNVVYTDFYSNCSYLVPREEKVCPVLPGCTRNSNCHYTNDLPGCRNRSGLIYAGGGFNYLDTVWSTKGLRDFQEDSLATLSMRKIGCTKGSGNWHVYPGNGRDLIINEENPFARVVDLLNTLGDPYSSMFLTQEIRINLYAGWKGCS